MKRIIPILIIFAFIAGLFFTLRKNPLIKNNAETEKMMVSASFYPLYFFASAIGGDKTLVSNVTPAGTEPHEYDPTLRDIALMNESDILILNGAGFEPWAEKVKMNLDKNKTEVLNAGEEYAVKQLKEDALVRKDPHTWLSPGISKNIADKIKDAYIKKDPANSDFYAKNAENLKMNLDELDLAFQEGLKDCKRRDFITSHEAFSYLASEYNLNQIGISGISPDEEPSLKKLAEVSDFVNKNGIKYIFFESLGSPKFSLTIAKETGAKTLVLNPIEGLSSEDTQKGEDYFTEMRKNLSNLKIALECK